MAPAETSSAAGCVEVLGGNEARAHWFVLGGLELLLVARPAGATAGGDVYCIHSCEDRTLVKIVLIDITGHGTRSAVMAQAIHHLLHQHSADTQPSRLLELINQRFPEIAPPGILATSACTVYDSRSGELHYANGGQPRILFCSARRQSWASLGQGWESPCGVPFGVTTGACYDEESLAFEPGDTLLMYSDGVAETTSPTGALLQAEGVLQLVRELTPATEAADISLAVFASTFLHRLQDFHGSRDFQDDLTLVWARRLPDGAPGPQERVRS